MSSIEALYRRIEHQELRSQLARFTPSWTLRSAASVTGQFVPVTYTFGVYGEPALLRLMAEELCRIVGMSTVDVIAGIDLRGVPLAVAMSLFSGKPLVLVRERPKRTGRSAVIGGLNFLGPGKRVLLVDDLMAYGGTKQQRAELIEATGALVTDIAVAFDVSYAIPPTRPLPTENYNRDGLRWMKERGIRFHALSDYRDLVQCQWEAGMISPELHAVLKEVVNGPYWEQKEHLEQLLALMRKEGTGIDDFTAEYMRAHGVEV